MTSKYSEQGSQTLLILDKAKNFTDWMYAEIKPYLEGNILEIGSGIGTYSEKIINDFKDNKIILSDIDSNFVKVLKERFTSKHNLIISKIDLTKLSDLEQIKSKINTVFALNVLEHIEDDVSALNNVYSKLEHGGKFVILVPAHKFLFNTIDKAVGHYRRYTKKDIVQKVSETKFKIKKMFYFNFVSMLAWYINGNILKKSEIIQGAMSLFNKMVPIFRFFEKFVLFKKMGISLIVVLEKD